MAFYATKCHHLWMKISVSKLHRRNRVEWMVYWSSEGKRNRRFFRSRREAETEAATLELQRKRSGDVWLALTAPERAELIAVFEEVKRAGFSLRVVWDGFRSGPRAKPNDSRTLREAIRETLASKIESNRRTRYIESLEWYLTKFARGREAATIDSIGAADIEMWFRERNESPSAKASNIGRLSAMFGLCKRRGYCSENPCDRIDRPTVETKPPIVLTPKQAEALLKFTAKENPHRLAYLVLALMAGLRPEELEKLTWESIDLKGGIVRVDAAASKVRQRRIIHLMPVAKQWMTLAAKSNAELPTDRQNRKRFVRRLRGVLGFETWPQDLLRHTAASYLLAHFQDAGKVADELGNSAGILLRHYRELIGKEQAAEFWSIRP